MGRRLACYLGVLVLAVLAAPALAAFILVEPGEARGNLLLVFALVAAIGVVTAAVTGAVLARRYAAGPTGATEPVIQRG